jgi:septum formation protein
MNSQPPVILASGSPRRRLLLAQIGIDCDVRAAEVDETVLRDEKPADYVLRLATKKAEAVAMRRAANDRRPVLAADTAVVVDQTILGKPVDREDYRRQLGLLSGKTHQVFTGVALIGSDSPATRLNVSHVKFRPLEMVEIDDYWKSGEPFDKAGSYAIQGRAAAFIQHIEGSYSGIMGLPLFETAELLNRTLNAHDDLVEPVGGLS